MRIDQKTQEIELLNRCKYGFQWVDNKTKSFQQGQCVNYGIDTLFMCDPLGVNHQYIQQLCGH